MEKSFVERRFDLDDSGMIVRFHAPAVSDGGEYQCVWVIEWPDRSEQHRACGEDGIQALMLAMKAVHIRLVSSDAYKNGRLTLWGQADLDLPPTWGAGPLYYIPPRARPRHENGPGDGISKRVCG